MTLPSDYLAVLVVKQDELAQPTPNKAVLATCDLFLAVMQPPLFTTFLEKSLPKGDQ